MRNTIRVAGLASVVGVFFASMASAQPTLAIEDYVATPITGKVDGKGSNELLLSRVNTIREEAGGASRLFISDMNGPLYIFDKASKKFTVYLDFNGNEGKTGLFRRLYLTRGYGNGLNGFYLDPEYTRNGKFYTTHMEDPKLPGSNLPNNASFSGLNVGGYTTTDAIRTPGPLQNEGVLIQWTDSNPSNSTFEGTARELLRVTLNTTSHPLGDLIFNPTARPGDPDWRVLYMECGDGASGESKIVAIRSNPQRLDNLEGKIVRIIPDLDSHVATSTVSENGRYRIPNDNPFVSTPGARKEIWAYGFRNPHRLNWAVDPANPANNRLIVNSVGMSTWETVYIVHKGANYGYARREGNELFTDNNRTAPLPEDDRIPLQIGDEPTNRMIVPNYPVIQYGHDPKGGDSIGSGFVYYGKAIPALRGKYIFTDLTTGRIWYAEYKDMLAADDGKPATLAPIHEVKVRWNNTLYDDMYPVVESAYHTRGGTSPKLQGPQGLIKGGRADVRFSIDAGGELYLYSKSDGVIRKVAGATGFPQPPTSSASSSQFVAHTIDTGLKGGYQSVVVDLNRDGKPDVIGLAMGLRQLAWYENPPSLARGGESYGAASPTWEKHVLVSDVSGLINVAAHDTDRDGIPELALAQGFATAYDRSAGILSVLTHQGDPEQPWSIKEIDRTPTAHRLRFVDRTVIDQAITDGHTLVSGDFDGDGRDELVAGERGGKRSVYIYRLSDPRAYNWEKSVLDDGMAGAGCAVADLTADKRLDIVCIGSATANLKWYENTGLPRRSSIGFPRAEAGLPRPSTNAQAALSLVEGRRSSTGSPRAEAGRR